MEFFFGLALDCWSWLPSRQFRTASGLPHVLLKYRFWKAGWRWHSGKRNCVFYVQQGRTGEVGTGNDVNANVFPGLICWQTEWTPSHLNLSQRVWHIFCWQRTSPAQHPAAVGPCAAVFLHPTLHHGGWLNRCCQGHSVFGSCQLSVIIFVAYPFLLFPPQFFPPCHSASKLPAPFGSFRRAEWGRDAEWGTWSPGG